MVRLPAPEVCAQTHRHPAAAAKQSACHLHHLSSPTAIPSDRNATMNAIASFSTSPQKASLIIGSSVVTPNGESLGDIKDMVVDPRTGRVTYCVVSFGGFMGMRSKLFAIPFNALAYDLTEDEYVLDVSKQRMGATPGFDVNHWPFFADEQWGGQINSFFNTPPYWNNTVDKLPAVKGHRA